MISLAHPSFFKKNLQTQGDLRFNYLLFVEQFFLFYWVVARAQWIKTKRKNLLITGHSNGEV